MKAVLVVEDDLSLRNLYQKILESNGFKPIYSASNGLDALEIYKSLPQKPELVLMDYRMPLKNGLDTSKELLALNKNIKIILITADAAIKEEAETLGVISFKAKPITMKYLMSNIEKAINLT